MSLSTLPGNPTPRDGTPQQKRRYNDACAIMIGFQEDGLFLGGEKVLPGASIKTTFWLKDPQPPWVGTASCGIKFEIPRRPVAEGEVLNVKSLAQTCGWFERKGRVVDE